MEWQNIERPGHFGKRRNAIIQDYNEKYGENNWRIAWEFKREMLDFAGACQLYEKSYLDDSRHRQEIWLELVLQARDVYDHEPLDTVSRYDYTIQKGTVTHIQDIAIRNVVRKRGWIFKGNKLVQIRSHSEHWGQMLSPGKVFFHEPESIIKPRLKGWWEENSVEDFYQSNKWLQVKEI